MVEGAPCQASIDLVRDIHATFLCTGDVGEVLKASLKIKPGEKDSEIIQESYTVQRAAKAWIKGFVESFLESSTGRWAILQLLCTQAWKKIARRTSKKIN